MAPLRPPSAKAWIIRTMHEKSALSVFFSLKIFSKRLIWVVVAFDTQDFSVKSYHHPNVNFPLMLNNIFFWPIWTLNDNLAVQQKAPKTVSQLAGYRSVRGPHLAQHPGPY